MANFQLVFSQDGVSSKLGAGDTALDAHPDALRSTSGRTLLVSDPPLEDGAAVVDKLEKAGPSALNEITGAFAAVWANRESGAIYLARDRFGLRALYRGRIDRDTWVVGTSIRGLIEAGVPRQLDPRGLESYLRMGSVYEPLTVLAGVTAVMPGRCERLALDGGVQRDFAWSADGSGSTREPTNGELGEALRVSVHRHASDVSELGVFASGGSDSTGLLLTLEDLGVQSVHTVSLAFGGDDAGASEHPYQRAAAERFGTKHHEWVASREAVEALLPTFFDGMDQPTIDGLNSFLVARVAAEAGIRTVFTGFGGDEVLCGYSTFETLPRMMAGLSLLRRCPRALRRAVGSAVGTGASYTRPEREKLALFVAEAPELDAYYELRRSLFLPDQVARLTGTDPQPLGEALTECSSPEVAPLARWSQLELRNHLSNTLIRSSDCFARNLGVDLRFPYIDSKLIDLSLRVPDGRKCERGHRKPLMRDLFAGRLPDFVWADRKRHFHVPLDRWLMRSSYTLRNVSFLDPEEVDRIVRAYRSRPGLRTYSRLWALYVLSESLPRLLGDPDQ